MDDVFLLTHFNDVYSTAVFGVAIESSSEFPVRCRRGTEYLSTVYT